MLVKIEDNVVVDRITGDAWPGYIPAPAEVQIGWAVEGKAFLPPPPPLDSDLPEPVPVLTPRQFWRGALALGITEADADAMIDAMPDPFEQEAARIDKNKAVAFEKDHPLIAQFMSQTGISQAAVDAMWEQAETF